MLCTDQDIAIPGLADLGQQCAQHLGPRSSRRTNAEIVVIQVTRRQRRVVAVAERQAPGGIDDRTAPQQRGMFGTKCLKRVAAGLFEADMEGDLPLHWNLQLAARWVQLTQSVRLTTAATFPHIYAPEPPDISGGVPLFRCPAIDGTGARSALGPTPR